MPNGEQIVGGQSWKPRDDLGGNCNNSDERDGDKGSSRGGGKSGQILMEAVSGGSADGLYVECTRKESQILARTTRENGVSINSNRKDSVGKFWG